MRLATALLFGALASASASAQAPVVTERGDPSVRDDTIYKLAVRPEDHPDEAFVYLLDDGVVRYDADGRGTRTFRYVAQVLTQEAVETWGENSFSYDSSRERLRLNWARVVDLQGNVLADKPTHDQESLAPVASSAPVYTDQKVRRISLGAVAPGTIVDYSYTIETIEPVLPGDFIAHWGVHTGRPTLRSRYVLDLPADLTVRMEERNLNFRRQQRDAGGRRVYTWATRDVPKVEGEPFAALDSNTVYMGITVGGPTTWADVGRWYAGLARDRYALTPEIETKLAEVVKPAKTREDSLRALHRWVAQDFRYVSLSLGIGGYQPRTPAQVWETQYGDCKDKATFFIAAARKLGFTAEPVLLSSGGGVDQAMPSISQFDHMIAAVEKPGGGGWWYLDLTAELTPFGVIPPGYQGEFGLRVRDDGSAEPVTFPEDAPEVNRSASRLVGELLADGTFNGAWSHQAGGWRQYSLRSTFSAKMSQKQRDDMTRTLANAVIDGASGDSLVIFDGRDLTADPRMSLSIRGGKALTSAGPMQIFNLPLPNYASTSLIADLEARKAREARRFDIDVADVVGPHVTVSELEVTLPEGWKATLPPPIDARSAFGHYTAAYAQDGRILRVRRTLSGTEGRRPKTEMDALIEWLKAVAKDDVKFIVLSTS
jgi:transglutaminase-like putative cysteine protease